MNRRVHRAKALICIALLASTHYWTGCGQSLPLNAGEGILIPLTPDHPVSRALADTQFSGAKAIIYFPTDGSFKLVFPDAGRQMSGHAAHAVGGLALADFAFARNGDSASIQMSPSTKQITSLTASNGFNWRPVTIMTTPSMGNDLATFQKANAELLVQQGAGQSQPASPQQPSPTSPSGGTGSAQQPAKEAAAFVIGFAFIAILFTGAATILLFTLLFLLIQAILDALNGGNPGDGTDGGTPDPNPVPPTDTGDGGNGGDNGSGPTSPLPPSLTNDVVQTPEDTPVLISVLSNDSDPDGTLAPASVSVTVLPAHGQTSVNSTTGQITYNPAADYNGPDSLTYQACDNGNPQNCATATVAITVTPVNDAPRVVTPIPDQSVPVGGSFSLAITGTFTDIDAGDFLTYSAGLSGGAELPAWLIFNPSTGQFSGVPGFKDRGVLAVVVTATDSGNASTPDQFQLTVTPGSLFTETADTVDFNLITADSYLAGGQYDALGGDDDVTLPQNLAAAQAAGFDPGNTFFGNAGNDTIRGGDLDDHIDAGIDDDHVFGSGGADQLEGGEGIDWLDYSLVSGPVFADLLSGTTFKPQTDRGEGPADAISGFENLRGSPNAGDTLRGSDVANIIEGLGGNDVLEGRGGNDTLNGGEGTDRADYTGSPLQYAYSLDLAGLVITDNTPDRNGSDLLISIEQLGFNQGSLILTIVPGTAGPDALTGTDANDLVLAFDGDDTIHGSLGSDYILGDGGVNAVDYSAMTVGMTIDLVAGTAAKAGGASGTDILSGIRNVIGSPQGDSITGDAAANQLSGLAGADTLIGGSGDDELTGGPGDDVIDGGADTDLANYSGAWDQYTFALNPDNSIGMSDTVNARDGSDSLLNIERINFALDGTYNLFAGTDGAESLAGSTGNDLILAFGGGDTLTGDSGDDILQGGAGTDTVVLQGSIQQYTYSFDRNAVKTVDGTPGRDGADYLLSIERINFLGQGTYNLRSGTNASDVVAGTAGNDLLLGFEGDDTLSGSDGSDYLFGGNGTNTVDYSTVSGGVNVDLNLGVTSKFFGTFGQDQLRNISNAVGSPGNDTLSGDASPNVLSGGAGNDTIYGRESGDTLNGDAGDDTLFGDVGDDTLNGGEDNDTLVGYGGDDTNDGGPGNDTAAYQGTWYEYRYSLDAPGVLRIADTVFPPMSATSRDGSDTNRNIETLFFFNFGALNLVLGSTASDNLAGTSGNDLILGFDGNDTLTGNGGDDILIGGPNDDTMTGGPGTDVFVFDLAGTNAAPGNDTVIDYSLAGTESLAFLGVSDFDGNSTVNLADLDFMNTTTFADQGANLRITFAGGGSITLNGLGGLGITSFASFVANGGNVLVVH